MSQPLLDTPEALWKGYIDFEVARGGRARARVLYERLLDRAGHVKVWLSYARFEAEPLALPEEGAEGEVGAAVADDEEEQQLAEARAAEAAPDAPAQRAARARTVYERGFRALRERRPDAKEEAVLLLEAWRDFERGTAAFRPAADVEASVAAVEKRMPRRIKRKRPVAPGSDVQEEFYDFVFPEEVRGGSANE